MGPGTYLDSQHAQRSMWTHATTMKYGLCSLCVFGALTPAFRAVLLWFYLCICKLLRRITWICRFSCANHCRCARKAKQWNSQMFLSQTAIFFIQHVKWILACFFKYLALIVFRVLASPTQPPPGDFFWLPSNRLNHRWLYSTCNWVSMYIYRQNLSFQTH